MALTDADRLQMTAIALMKHNHVVGKTTADSADMIIKFYDYDGTLIKSCTLSQAAALTALPIPPSHDGLTFDGWNYTLTQVNNLTVATNIGAMYITSDGTTKLNITVAALGRTVVPLYITQTVANGVTINWGDGSANTSSSSVGNVGTGHNYTAVGNYTITLTVADGCTLGLGWGTSPNTIMGPYSGAGWVYANMLQSINIGKNVTTIAANAFLYCTGLKNITIPSGVTTIGANAFGNCYKLNGIIIPSGVTTISDSALTGCDIVTYVILPPGITTIGLYAFQGCNMDNITLPLGVTNIGACAFRNCNRLKSIRIPSGVIAIDDHVFDSCYCLTDIILPSGLEYIFDYAFYNCRALTSITLPSGVHADIGSYAFYCCKSLKEFIIPSGVTAINSYAFYGCFGLKAIIIPAGVTRISDHAFEMCTDLTNLTILQKVDSIGQISGTASIGTYAFRSCSNLMDIRIPDCVTSIADYAFRDGSFVNIQISPRVTTISAGLFYQCSCTKYYDFTHYAAVPTLADTNAFNGIPSDCTIKVRASLLNSWKTATNWSYYAKYIVGV